MRIWPNAAPRGLGPQPHVADGSPKEGESGSEVGFGIQDCEIIDNLTGKRCQFVKRMGVYFMCISFQIRPWPYDLTNH